MAVILEYTYRYSQTGSKPKYQYLTCTTYMLQHVEWFEGNILKTEIKKQLDNTLQDM